MNEFEKYPSLAEHIKEIASQGRFIPDWNGFLEKLNKALIEAKTNDYENYRETTVQQ